MGGRFYVVGLVGGWIIRGRWTRKRGRIKCRAEHQDIRVHVLGRGVKGVKDPGAEILASCLERKKKSFMR